MPDEKPILTEKGKKWLIIGIAIAAVLILIIAVIVYFATKDPTIAGGAGAAAAAAAAEAARRRNAARNKVNDAKEDNIATGDDIRENREDANAGMEAARNEVTNMADDAKVDQGNNLLGGGDDS